MTSELDPSQQAVVTEAADARLVVTAPPGAGKSHVLVSRAQYLTEQDPQVRILMVSFSQAAVMVVRNRAVVAGLNNVDVVTVDSLAARLLLGAGDELAGSFDATIARVLSRFSSFEAELQSYGHVLVDEAQDVHGDRAELIDQVTRAAGCGATILGDARQRIFDFDTDTKGETKTLLDVVANAGYEVRTLTGSHRAKAKKSREAVTLRETGKAGSLMLARHVHTLQQAESLDDLATLLRRGEGTAGVLVRTRAQGAMISQMLAEAGRPVGVTAPAHATGASGWLARDLAEGPSLVTRAEFEQRIGDGWQQKWRQLRSMTSNKGKELSLPRLADALSSGRVLPAFVRAESWRRTISTVHRAKGLEFDIVVLINPLEWNAFGNSDSALPPDPDDEARVLYVALTRSIGWTYTSKCSQHGWKFERAIGRPVRTGRAGRGWTALGLEPTDALTREPLHPDRQAAQQEWLAGWTEPVTVETRINRLKSSAAGPIYDLIAADGGIVVGRTSSEFGSIIARSAKPTNWPELGSVVVDGVLTDSAAAGTSEHLPKNRLWLAPRVSGAARLTWKKATP